MARPTALSERARGVAPARRAAYEVLRRTFEHDAWADRAFRSAAERHGLSGRDRAFSQRLAYGAVQRRGTTDELVARLSGRGSDELDRPVIAALRLGLYELLFAGASAEHAAVGEAVELAKAGLGGGARGRGGGGLVNAVLRRAAREREEILSSFDDSTPEGAAFAHSQPLWIAERWWRELGPEGARGLMGATNEPAERALRVNTLRAERARLIAELRAAGEDIGPPAAEGILAPPEAVVAHGRWGDALRGRVAAGDAVAQSRASQAVVELLDPQPGERILDLCAGPGIKSTAIAARLRNDGTVRSLELDPGRAAEIGELCERLGVSCVHPEQADATRGDLGEGYDRILVDPPCTDLGALASRPDARWRKTPEQVERLAELQRRILIRAGGALRAGGSLVYSTCTVSRHENEEVVAAALEADGSLQADDLGTSHPGLASRHDPRFLQTLTDRDGTEGFFIARLRRPEA